MVRLQFLHVHFQIINLSSFSSILVDMLVNIDGHGRASLNACISYLCSVDAMEVGTDSDTTTGHRVARGLLDAL